jgi:diaminopimelate epimerase
MRAHFFKYHGLGNDFLLLDDRDRTLLSALRPEVIRGLCDRHEGIGADGIILRQDSAAAKHRMILRNADGTPAEISGNGLRCFAKFLTDHGDAGAGEITVETDGGVQRAWVHEFGSVETTMPLPRFGEENKPAAVEICVLGKCFMVVPVNVGNPHGVIFGPERDEEFARQYGSALQKHKAFPQGANIEFVSVMSPRSCRLVVWERGSGITRACGSGSVAAAAAGVGMGHFKFDVPIAVHQPGGTLDVTVARDFHEIRQNGPAKFVFEGEVNL